MKVPVLEHLAICEAILISSEKQRLWCVKLHSACIAVRRAVRRERGVVLPAVHHGTVPRGPRVCMVQRHEALAHGIQTRRMHTALHGEPGERLGSLKACKQM
jgi:hypothetical protein